MALESDLKPVFQKVRECCVSVHPLCAAECGKTAKEDKQVKSFIIAAVGIKIPGSGKQSTQICGQQFVDSENFRRPARNIMQKGRWEGMLQERRHLVCNRKICWSETKEQAENNLEWRWCTDETPQLFRKKRVQLDPTVENEELKLKISEELTSWLVDDWDLISRQHATILSFFQEECGFHFGSYACFKKSWGDTDNKKHALLRLCELEHY